MNIKEYCKCKDRDNCCCLKLLESLKTDSINDNELINIADDQAYSDSNFLDIEKHFFQKLGRPEYFCGLCHRYNNLTGG